MEADGLRLHAVVGGSGPPVLLLCGWPQAWFAWRLVMAPPADAHTVVALDPRGVGRSSMPAGGHFPAEEDPDATVAALSRFLARARDDAPHTPGGDR